jgi:hypothetical protein
MLENAIEATAHHPTPCWGKGGMSELTGRVHRGEGSKLRSVDAYALNHLSAAGLEHTVPR